MIKTAHKSEGARKRLKAGPGFDDFVSTNLDLPPGNWTVQLFGTATHWNAKFRLIMDFGVVSEHWGKGTASAWDVATITAVRENVVGGKSYPISLQAAKTDRTVGAEVELREITAIAWLQP